VEGLTTALFPYCTNNTQSNETLLNAYPAINSSCHTEIPVPTTPKLKAARHPPVLINSEFNKAIFNFGKLRSKIGFQLMDLTWTDAPLVEFTQFNTTTAIDTPPFFNSQHFQVIFYISACTSCHTAILYILVI
jgi:hypothetical protein